MREKSLFAYTLVILFICSSSFAEEKRTELEELIAIALQDNPEVQSYVAQSEAAQARIPQASSLEDPRIGFHVTNMPLSNLGFGSTPMSGKDFSVKQKIPFPGKLGVHKKAAKASAAAVNSLSRETQNRIRFQVEQAYFQLYRLDKEIGTVRKNKALLGNLAKVAEARFATALASGPDVFRAQTFKSMLENKLLSLRQERESAAAWVNTLLNRDPKTPLKLKYRFSLSRLPKKAPDNALLKERPLLRALESEIEAAGERVRLARRDYLPDFDLGFSYRQRDSVVGDPVRGSDFISGGVTINIPLWAHWRQSRKLQERKAQKLAVKHQYATTRNETKYEALDAYEQLKRQRRQINLYSRALLPQARATFESSYTAYEAESADFFSTIEALKDQHETELAFYELKADYETSRARLEWVLGQDLSQTKSEEQP